jgi:hypothetical protein
MVLTKVVVNAAIMLVFDWKCSVGGCLSPRTARTVTPAKHKKDQTIKNPSHAAVRLKGLKFGRGNPICTMSSIFAGFSVSIKDESYLG